MNKLLHSIIFLALLLQAMIPLGFMPDLNAHQGTALVICSGFGEKTVYVDDGETGSHATSSPCAYSIVAMYDGPALSPALALPFTLAMAATPRLDRIIPHAPDFIRPHAIGPPRSV